MYKAIKLVSYRRAVGKKKNLFSANFLFAIVVIPSGSGLGFLGLFLAFFIDIHALIA